MTQLRHDNGSFRRLYLDKKNGIIGGVCAGIADYFGLDRWLVRIIAITLFLFTNSLVIFIYIIAWIILKDKPSDYIDDVLEKELAFARLKRKITGKNAYVDTVSQFDQLELRLRRLEAYITSKQYKLRKEFNNL